VEGRREVGPHAPHGCDPVTLGQEFGGYARQIRLGIERVRAVLPRVGEVPLGGTAVGTGINTPLGFPQKVIALLAERPNFRSPRRRTTSRRRRTATAWSKHPAPCARSRSR
jgi:fumarate hydratase class II